MELRDMFSEEFQKAMKRVARGSQKGSVTEHPVSAASTAKTVVGKKSSHGNFTFIQPKKDKVVEEKAS